MSAYPCNCEPYKLFHNGCQCGAFAAEKADKEAVERVAAYEAKQRLNEQADFLIGRPPTAPQGVKLCKCGHDWDSHGDIFGCHASVGIGECSCSTWRPK